VTLYLILLRLYRVSETYDLRNATV